MEGINVVANLMALAARTAPKAAGRDYVVLEILEGKGGEETDKQLYKFQDHGQRWVGLRFDLTVPLARFAAQHINRLGTPLKRYHIATVWRGENTQRGRYREFMQCDFDTIGTRSPAADVETALVIHDLMRAIGFEEFTIRVNNRKVLSGLLERLDLAQGVTPILRALDKLAKMLGIVVDLDDIRAAGEYLDEQVSKAVEEKAELRDYVSRLEEEYRQGRYQAGETLGKDIIKEVEDFLRKKKELLER